MGSSHCHQGFSIWRIARLRRDTSEPLKCEPALFPCSTTDNVLCKYCNEGCFPAEMMDAKNTRQYEIKGEYCDCNNCRKFCLFYVTGKVFARVILSRNKPCGKAFRWITTWFSLKQIYYGFTWSSHWAKSRKLVLNNDASYKSSLLTWPKQLIREGLYNIFQNLSCPLPPLNFVRSLHDNM